MTVVSREPALDALAAARAVSDGTLAAEAGRVNADATFPADGIAALRQAGLLAAAVPSDHGGPGLTVRELVNIAEELGHGCGSTAMVWAMHQIQVASLVRHGRSPFLEDYVRELARTQPLLASATSEVGTGGNLLRSITAVEPDGDRIRLAKQATTVSYGAYADGILATARRSPDAEPHEQVLVLLLASDGLVREQRGDWNVMGMRGTVSPPFALTASAAPDRVLADPFDVIAAETMVPLSHLLWSACWLGIAGDALRRAVTVVRKKAGAGAGADIRLAEAQGVQRVVRATLREAVNAYADVLPNGRLEPDSAPLRDQLGPDFTLALNVLKLEASVSLVRVAELALEVCGIGGYREEGPESVARHLRDLYSARLMISNRRLLETNAQLAFVAGR